jgi:hypothetical protein
MITLANESESLAAGGIQAPAERCRGKRTESGRVNWVCFAGGRVYRQIEESCR